MPIVEGTRLKPEPVCTYTSTEITIQYLHTYTEFTVSLILSHVDTQQCCSTSGNKSSTD